MPVLYKSFQSQLKNKNGKKLFYPRVVQVGRVTTSQIAKEIADYSSLSPGDVKNSIENLVTVMTQHLQASESVTLDGLGTFSMVMNSNGKGVEKEEDVSAAQATVHVRFLPASTRNVDRTLATRSLVTGVKCIRYDKVANSGTGTNPGEPGGGSGNNPNPDEPGGGGSGEAPDPKG